MANSSSSGGAIGVAEKYDINCVGKSLQSAKCTGGACSYSVQGRWMVTFLGLKGGGGLPVQGERI